MVRMGKVMSVAGGILACAVAIGLVLQLGKDVPGAVSDQSAKASDEVLISEDGGGVPDRVEVASGSVRSPIEGSPGADLPPTLAVEYGSIEVKLQLRDGNPLSDVLVEIVRDPRTQGELGARVSRYVDKRGLVLFSMAAPGLWRVVVDIPGVLEESVVVEGGKCSELTFVVKGRALRVEVVDGGGFPIQGAEVLLASWPGTPATVVGHTDERGVFFLRGAPLRCAVGAIALGYAPSPLFALEASFAVDELLVSLDIPGGRLEGRIVGADGTAVVGAQVTVREATYGYSFERFGATLGRLGRCDSYQINRDRRLWDRGLSGGRARCVGFAWG